MANRENLAGLYVFLTLVGFAIGLVVVDKCLIRNVQRRIEEMLVVPNPNELPQGIREKYGDSETVRKGYAQSCEQSASLAKRMVDDFKSRSFRYRFRECWLAYLITGGLGAGGGLLVASAIRTWRTS